MAKRTKDKLTPKREKFAKLIAGGMTQADAYREAFDVDENSKPNTVYVEGSKLASNPKIAQRVEEFKRPGIRILEQAEETAAKKLVQLVTAEEEIVSADGETIIGSKRNTELNRKAANDVLEKLGYNGSEQKTTTNNTIIIMPREDVEEAIRRLSKSSL